MRTRHHVADLYAEVDLFRGCTKEERARIAALTTDVLVDSGKVLCEQGSPGTEAFVIVEGHAAVEIDGQRVAVVGPNDVVGELALLDGGPRVATVTALTPMDLLVLNRREFTAMLAASPEVALRVLTAVGKRLREAETHPLPLGT